MYLSLIRLNSSCSCSCSFVWPSIWGEPLRLHPFLLQVPLPSSALLTGSSVWVTATTVAPKLQYLHSTFCLSVLPVKCHSHWQNGLPLCPTTCLCMQSLCESYLNKILSSWFSIQDSICIKCPCVKGCARILLFLLRLTMMFKAISSWRLCPGSKPYMTSSSHTSSLISLNMHTLGS